DDGEERVLAAGGCLCTAIGGSGDPPIGIAWLLGALGLVIAIRRRIKVQARAHAAFQAALSGSAAASEGRGAHSTYVTRPSAAVSRPAEMSLAFGRRGIPARGVAPPSDTRSIFGRRALRAGRRDALGADRLISTGLLSPDQRRLESRRSPAPEGL